MPNSSIIETFRAEIGRFLQSSQILKADSSVERVLIIWLTNNIPPERYQNGENLIWYNFLFSQTLEIVTFKETNEFLYFFWVGGFFDSSLGNDVNHVEHSNQYYGNTGCGVFQTGYIKLEGFLPKNQHTQRIFLNFENWTNREPQ